MDQGPLVSEQIEDGARFLAEFDKHRPVQSAFWLKESEGGAWWLYVASDQITDDNFDVAYGEVLRVAQAMPDFFDPFQVKVLGQDDALAKAAADARLRVPRRGPIRLRDTTFGGLPVEEVYLYPSPLPAPAG
jgi:hypothetical protein